jgi:hypothetical protein
VGLKLPAQVSRQDEQIRGQRDPFTGLFFAPIPAGHTLLGIQVLGPRPQEVVTSFLRRRTLCAALEDLTHGTEVEVILRLGLAGPRPPRRAAPSSAPAGHPAPSSPPAGRAASYPPAARPAVARMRRWGHDFLLKKRRLPACSEIAAGLGVSPSEARRLAILTRAPLCEESVTRGALPRLRIATDRDSSLWTATEEEPDRDAWTATDEDTHLDDFLEDPSVVSPSDAVISMNLSEQTRQFLKTLTPREEKVLRMRFGIGEKSDHTLEEVGQDFEVTRERIRPISAGALRTLRRPSRTKKLKVFIDELRHR